MPTVTLRKITGTSHASDLEVTVQDSTFEYLMSSAAPEIRVSAYLDRDWDQIEASYSELYINDSCPYFSKVTKIIPGSRTRKDIALPGPMKNGEQLVVLVAREPKADQTLIA